MARMSYTEYDGVGDAFLVTFFLVKFGETIDDKMLKFTSEGAWVAWTHTPPPHLQKSRVSI